MKIGKVSKREDLKFLRISKALAKSLYEQGETVYLLPSTILISDYTCAPYRINLKTKEAFDYLVARFERNNCEALLPKTKYYILIR